MPDTNINTDINTDIDIEAIQASLIGVACGYVPTTASTQAAVQPNSLLIADHQSAGVGRRGNHWLTPPGRSICLSHRFTLPLSLEQMAGYQMTTALAITHTVKQFDPSAAVQLKWPNDLYHLGQKFAGILINLKPKKQVTDVIVGIGINWHLTDEQLQQVNQPVCNVPLKHKPNRTTFICQLMTQMALFNEDFVKNGLSHCLPLWLQHDYLLNKTIQLSGDQMTQTGQYAGINQRGELMIETDQGIKHFSSGEVSVKAL